ncbi:MAG: hypothetical protein ACOYMI_08125 [Phycisphaerales bacterium]|jgi:ribosomal protein L37AE/L43A
MLPLRILRFVNRAYPFVAFGAYGFAFVVAFICMFTFPLGALTLVVVGVLSLAFVALGSDALKGLERALSRRALRRGRCPACRMGPAQSVADGWSCRGCAANFEPDGTQRVAEVADEPEQASEDAAAVSVA